LRNETIKKAIEESIVDPLTSLEIEELPSGLKMLTKGFVTCFLTDLHARLRFNHLVGMFEIKICRPWESPSETVIFISVKHAEFLGRVCHVTKPHPPLPNTPNLPDSVFLIDSELYVGADGKPTEPQAAFELAVQKANESGKQYLSYLGILSDVSNLAKPTTCQDQLGMYAELCQP